MTERLWFPVEGTDKKEILDALKNEQKYNKKIPIIDSTGEDVAKTIKWDSYHTYIDFWLDNYIADFATKEPGRIQSIQIYDFTTPKGAKIKRVKQIVA